MGEKKAKSEPIDECGCQLVRTAKGLHMQECSLHKMAPKLMEACKEALSALNQIPNKKLHGNFKDSYAVCSYLEKILKEAGNAPAYMQQVQEDNHV